MFARFTALDLRDAVTPVGAFRPGSVARTPGAVLRETEDRWLMLFGSALGQYVWTVVADAADNLGGGPVGVDSLQGRGDRACVRSSARKRMWRKRGELKDSYDVVIIGGGSHGLATAYYLARDHGITDVAILEKNYIGSGAAGRNTTILRSNYKTVEGAKFYDASLKLYEGLGAELELQPALLAERPPHPGPHRPRDVRDGQPRGGQPPQRASTRG